MSNVASPPSASRTIAGFLTSSVGNLLYYLVSLGSLAALGRLLEPADFGVAAVALFIFSISRLVADLGLSPALVQAKSLTAGTTAAAVRAVLFGSIALTCLLWWTVPYIVSHLFEVPAASGPARLLLLVLPFASLGAVAQALVERELRFRPVPATKIAVDGFLHAGLSITLAYRGYGVWSLVVANAVARLVYAATMLLLARPSLHAARPDLGALRKLFQFAFPMVVSQAFNFVGREGDTGVAARYLSAESLGTYTRAFRLMVIPANLVGATITRVLFPTLSRSNPDHDRRSMGMALGTLTVVMMPATVLMAIVAPEVVSVVLGTGWEDTVAPLRVLALGLLPRVGYKLAGALAQSRGALARVLPRQVAYGVTIVVAAIALSRYGSTGIAAGVLIGLMVQYIGMWQLVWSLDAGTPRGFVGAHLRAIPATLLTAGVALGASASMRDQSFPSAVVLTLSVGAAIGALLTAAALFPTAFGGAAGRWWHQRIRLWVSNRK